MPASDVEVEANHRRSHDRAMTGLMNAARAREGAHADAMIRLTPGFESRKGEELRERRGAEMKEDDSPPARMNVATGLLDRLQWDPEAHAAQIREIRHEYGNIFVPRDKMEELRAFSTWLRGTLQGL